MVGSVPAARVLKQAGCFAGRDAQLCSPCQTSADCGRIGSHTTLPDTVGGLPKGHILAAHFPTVCHHRACVPLQVPDKDAFCKELKATLASHEQQQQQTAQKPAHSFVLGNFVQKAAEPLMARLGGRKATPARPPVRRLQQAGPLPAGDLNLPSEGASAQPIPSGALGGVNTGAGSVNGAGTSRSSGSGTVTSTKSTGSDTVASASGDDATESKKGEQSSVSALNFHVKHCKMCSSIVAVAQDARMTCMPGYGS